jgi:lipase
MCEPVLHRVVANGVSLAYFDWHPELRGLQPSLLMAHATGFHGRVWDQIITRLPNRHVIALEQRGHGRSQTTEIDGWGIFGRDLAAFATALDLHGVIGIGHSMGAHALVQAAAYEPARFARLVLIDPVILEPLVYHRTPAPEGTVHPAAGRLNRFESVQAMIDRFANRPPYSLFAPEALRDYCEYGLLPAEEGGGFRLACAPITEARVYLTSWRNAGIYASIRALKIPVLIIRARLPAADRKAPDFGSSPTWTGLVSEFEDAREIYLADRSHLAPMEDPVGIAQLINDELNLHGKVKEGR